MVGCQLFLEPVDPYYTARTPLAVYAATGLLIRGWAPAGSASAAVPEGGVLAGPSAPTSTPRGGRW
jgi:hypothetical protein